MKKTVIRFLHFSSHGFRTCRSGCAGYLSDADSLRLSAVLRCIQCIIFFLISKINIPNFNYKLILSRMFLQKMRASEPFQNSDTLALFFIFCYSFPVAGRNLKTPVRSVHRYFLFSCKQHLLHLFRHCGKHRNYVPAVPSVHMRLPGTSVSCRISCCG